jgi:hypothetical protein
VEPDLLYQSVFLAGVNIVLAVAIIAVNWWAASGRLQRNQWVGIRIPSTMRSDQAWVTGHRAALRLTPLYLLVLAGTLTALSLAVLSAEALRVVLDVADTSSSRSRSSR